MRAPCIKCFLTEGAPATGRDQVAACVGVSAFAEREMLDLSISIFPSRSLETKTVGMTGRDGRSGSPPSPGSDVYRVHGPGGSYCKMGLSPTAQGHCAFGGTKLVLSISLGEENLKVSQRRWHHSLCVTVQRGI